MTETELYVPDPPVKLEASQEDIAVLEAFVRRFGWHETMWHIGQLLVKAHGEASGTRKQALKALANYLNFISPGARVCDVELQLHRPDDQPATAE